jgi:AraC-like DNA-binding protein
MDQRPIALDLNMKGLSAMEIRRDHMRTVGPQAGADSTVTWDLQAPSFRDRNEGDSKKIQEATLDEVDETILTELVDEPFSSMHKLARHIGLSRTTVHWHLKDSLGLTVRHLRCLPQHLSADQKAARVNLSRKCHTCLHDSKLEPGMA